MMTGRVCLVTGGNRGIGLACAISLAKRGAHIVVLSKSGDDRGCVKAIRDLGVRCEYYKCDVSNYSEVEACVGEITLAFSKIDILVNAAGITKDKLLLSMTEDDFKAVMDVNLIGTFNTIKACIKGFVKNRYGRIVNISSVAGMAGNAGQVNYAASKAGVIGLSKSVAKEYASRGITCNVVAPGYIDTDMTKSLSDDMKKKIIEATPVGRMGTAQDIAAVVTFLADESSSFITGEVIKADGGMYI